MKHGPLTFEYDKISEYVYVGSNMCCKGHFKKELLRKGIKADVSVEDKSIDAPVGADYYFWLPTENHKAFKKEKLIMGVKILRELEKKKVKAYVHCQRGHGRAPTLVIAFLVSKGMSLKQAHSFFLKKRPSAHPNKRQLGGVLRALKELRKAAYF